MELTRTSHRRRTRRTAACAALTLCAGGALAGAAADLAPAAQANSHMGAAAASTPPKDTFHGRIVKATGGLSGDRDDVTILLHVAQSTDAARHLDLVLVGAACGTASHCLRLSGTLTGTISAHPATMPDVGRRYDLSVSGQSGTLGRVTGSGTVSGVGFIRAGHEGLTLTLRAKRGSITINAVSPKVPGFTSP